MAHVQNLFCQENFKEDLEVTPKRQAMKQRLFVAANKDQTLLSDRVINNILLHEKPSVSEDYFLTVQTSILPHMRKIVTAWMLEVCEDQHCHPEVFFHAVNYMDRFLSKVNIQKTQFQMIASICLLLASKMLEVSPISISQLVIYSDYSVTEQEMVEGELLVLTKIGWELSVITPLTVYNTIKHRIVEHDSYNTVYTILTICATHHTLSSLSPSLLSSATIIATMNLSDYQHILHNLVTITHHTVEDITTIATVITKIVGRENMEHKKYETERPATPQDVLNISQEEITV